MIEASRQLAEKYTSLFRCNTVIPFEDLSLTNEAFVIRRNRRLQSPDKNPFLIELRNLLSNANISNYFKEKLVMLASNLEAHGFKYWDNEVEESVQSFVGIDFKQGKYGIFDPKRALSVEFGYYARNILPELREGDFHNYREFYLQWGESLRERTHKKWFNPQLDSNKK